jgi:hypothetical protein
MSTRSWIGIVDEDENVDFIYCHFDGYPTHHLPILTNHYNTPEKIKELLRKGEMSDLKESVGTCDYYCDRGEDIKIQHDTLDNVRSRFSKSGIDYLYLYQDSGWTYNKR